MNLFKTLSLRLKFFLGSLFYLSYAPKAFLYTRQRDRIEREFPIPQTEDTFDNPGKLLRAESKPRGARFYFEQAELEVSFLTPDLVRVEWFPSLPPLPYAISRKDWPEVETTLSEITDGWIVLPKTPAEQESGVLNVIIQVDGTVIFCDSTGKTLREELPPQRSHQGWTHQARLREEEQIYGLGERAAPLNLRAAKDEKQQTQTFRMWNYDAAGMYGPGSDPMYICIPVYLGLHSSGSYLIFYENSFEANFTFGDVATAAFEGGALRYYVTAGSPAQLLERYTELTGRPPLPPRWALGYQFI